MRIGIDLGGTKIEIVALGRDGQTLYRSRVATPQGDYDGTIDAVERLVREAESTTGQRGSVGIGMPGAVSPATGLIKNANSTWLNGRPFAEDVGAALGRPVRLANDANCFALSEATDGAAAGHAVVFGVILGTGAGGGLVVDGKPLTGPNAIAGEWGHNPLPWATPEETPGPPCYCRKNGCIEVWCSGPGLAADFARVTGRPSTAEQIATDAAAGEPDALATLARYEDRLARALASVINIVDPGAIVLGGGLSNLDRLYTTLAAMIEPHVFSDRCSTPILKNKWGDSSGVRGAAWLWPQDPP